MTATADVRTRCADHQRPLYPSRQAAEEAAVAKRAQQALRGGQRCDYRTIRCRHSGQAQRWHLMPDSPHARAERLVADLRALGTDLTADVTQTCLAELPPCDHDQCSELGAVWLTMDDPLDARAPLGSARCYRHAVAWARWLLADPHRRVEHQVVCEVTPV